MENVTKFAAKMLKLGKWPFSNKFETFDIKTERRAASVWLNYTIDSGVRPSIFSNILSSETTG